MTDALQAIAATTMDAAAAGAPSGGYSADLDSLAHKFNRLMGEDPDPSAYAAQNLHNGESQVTHFLRAQETALQHTFDDVRALSVQAPHMDPQELAAKHIEMSYQIAMVQVQFNASVYVAQSGKTGLQTLMKNHAPGTPCCCDAPPRWCWAACCSAWPPARSTSTPSRPRPMPTRWWPCCWATACWPRR